jgi:cytochrome c
MKSAAILLVLALAALSTVASASQQLAQKNQCMSCHQVERKVVGPAFKEVAKKYKGNADAEAHLIAVVKKGGKGVWGNAPMPPHPQIKDDDAKAIIGWVLSL